MTGDGTRRVFLHIGLPKTATTYLQTVLWAHRARMRAQGVLLPGDERRDHLWASRMVREDDHPRSADDAWQAGAWDRVRAEIAAWPGTAVVSHEFFAAASRGAGRAAIDRRPRAGRGAPGGHRA